jgi:3-hydroxyisobutyrate dehydrogenase-like beta-hydroxyacid dehydrogenase
MLGITRKAIKMKVGFIGLGIMGMPMATNIAKKYPLIGYDVVKKETPFPFASSYEEVVSFADVIITMVPKSEHMIAVYSELKKSLKRGQICIDMSTIYPEVSKQVAQELRAIGVPLLDCPVVKSQPAAVAGELGIYVGGDEKVYHVIKPILECMGKNIIYMGPNGSGILMKIIHNGLVGEIQNGVNEMMVLASKAGLNLADVVKAIGYGGGQNFYLDGKAKNIIAGTYPTAFSVENMAKDVHFGKDLLAVYGIEAPGLENVCKVYEQAMAEGLAKSDFSATYEIVKKEKRK